MFGWVKDIIAGMRDAIMEGFSAIGETLSNTIWTTMLHWIYDTIYGGIADFFTLMGNMGADMFDLPWVEATIRLFTLFGWSLFIVGTVVAIFDVAIEYQTGRANIKSTTINILKGFFACSLIGILPVELYKLCISLQHTFASDLGTLFADVQISDMGTLCWEVFYYNFTPTGALDKGIFHLVTLIMFTYAVIKIFFQNIKRGGILLVQMSVGSLYMFSVPRGIFGRIYELDETGCGDMLDGIYANNAFVFRFANSARAYLTWHRHYACGNRSTENRATVRYGYFDAVQCNGYCPRNNDGNQLNENDR